ncbi:unnamed protein product [Owenia fusiformis]|uniref:Large ribosomal subunit protein mL62 n=1 Tax=Owenia fusiformis TaxID=6347 RepID=A0A8S4NGA0_OWEFU|nr:unnamed protein product [Owenia fusiformis]
MSFLIRATNRIISTTCSPNKPPSFLLRNLYSSDKYSGSVPIDKVKISFSRSSGPGGQHVNTTNSKVEVRFHIQSADWLTDDLKLKLMKQESGRITKDGFIIVTSQISRKQNINQTDCLNKIENMIKNAAVEEKEPDELTKERHRKRKEKIKQETLRKKREISMKKQWRRM